MSFRVSLRDFRLERAVIEVPERPERHQTEAWHRP